VFRAVGSGVYLLSRGYGAYAGIQGNGTYTFTLVALRK